MTHPPQPDDVYPIVDVPDDAVDLPEQMGSKPKFWYHDAALGVSLYKEARPGTGEDWSEKAACELAQRLGLPHARVELARWRDTRGIATPSFVGKSGALLHGNEVLASLVPDYYPQPGAQVRQFCRIP